MRLFTRKQICCGFVLLILACPMQADDEAVKLPEFSVSSPPLVQENVVSVYGGGYSVVSGRQIADLNASDIASTLRTTPGVNISRYNRVGSYGGSGGGAVFIRGMGASRPGSELLVMYDGVPRYNAVFSHPLLDILSIDGVDSVQVYKGVQPQFFGNAFAAVDIVPGRYRSEGRGGRVSLAYGVDDTFIETFSYGGKHEDFDLNVGQSFRRSDGHRKNSGGELRDYFLRVGYMLNEYWDLSFFGAHTDNYAEDPGLENSPYHMGDYQTRDFLSVLTLANRYSRGEGYIKPYWNRGRARWYDQGMQGTGASPAASDTRNTFIDWDLYGMRIRERVQPWAGAELIAGADIDVESGKVFAEKYDSSQDAYLPRESFRLYSPYIALAHQWGGREGGYIRPSAGLRFYEHDVFGSEFSPHAGIVAGRGGTELHAMYSRGVSYPGLNVAVFSHALMPPIAGNPSKRDLWRDLDAETLNHFELGVRKEFTKELKIEATAFLDRGRNRYVMTFAQSGTPLPMGFQNISSYNNRGLELVLNYVPENSSVSFFAGATCLHTSVRGMPYAPKWTASSGVTWRFLDRFRLSMDLLYQGGMHVNPDNAYGRNGPVNPEDNPRVGSSFVVNAKLSYSFRLKKEMPLEHSLFLSLENITDRDYYYRPGYPMPGIGGILGVELRF